MYSLLVCLLMYIVHKCTSSKVSEAVLRPPYYLSYDVRTNRIIDHVSTNVQARSQSTDHRQLSLTSPLNSSKSGPMYSTHRCLFDEDCSDEQWCDLRTRTCSCPANYVHVQQLIEWRPLVTFELGGDLGERDTRCYQLSQLNEVCHLDGQCLAVNAQCPKRHFVGVNACRCRPGYRLTEGKEKYLIDGKEITAVTVCRLDTHDKADGLFVAMVIVIGLLTIACLIACLVGLIKLRKRKQRGQDTITGVLAHGGGQNNQQGQVTPGQHYMTSSGQVVVATSDGHMVPVNQQEVASIYPGQQQQQQMSGNAGYGQPPPPHVHRHQVGSGGYVRPEGPAASMGSAQAEFENDFIEVFPMHHLEPCPEKNMSALIMQ